jgi:hypothetical protein
MARVSCFFVFEGHISTELFISIPPIGLFIDKYCSQSTLVVL